MSTYKIAFIGESRHDFEILEEAQRLVENDSNTNEKNKIVFVNISNKSEEEVLSIPGIHAIMYSTENRSFKIFKFI